MLNTTLNVNENSGISVAENSGNITQITVDKLVIACKEEIPENEIKERIFSYFTSILESFSLEQDYIKRSAKLKDRDETTNTIDALAKYHQVLMLADAGMGKTIEAKHLVANILKDNRFDNHIPVFIEAKQFPVSFSDIYKGIINELSPCFSNYTETVVSKYLQTDSFIFIIDGIDEITEGMQSFIANLDSFIKKFPKSFIFITCRHNQYHNYFPTFQIVELQKLSELDVRHYFQRQQINSYKFTKNYIEIFQTPFLLFLAGKLFKNDQKTRYTRFYNKSELLYLFTLNLAGQLDEEKGINKIDKNYHSIFMKIGEVAYNNFDKNVFSKTDFDKYFSPEFSSSTLFKKLRLELFVENELNISYKHRLFKEFLVAYFLNEKFSFSKETINCYQKIVIQEEYIEVLTFIAGLIKNITTQNMYFDFLLKNNFIAYLSCLRSKNDLSDILKSYSPKDYALYYLTQFYDSYTKIIDKYFLPLKYLFDPVMGVKKDTQITLYGFFSEDFTRIDYWFDRETNPDKKVYLVKYDEIQENYKNFEMNCRNDKRTRCRNMVNLSLSNLERDSARVLAIKTIHSELKDILKKHLLRESDYLLCEAVEYAKNTMPEIKNYETIEDISEQFDKLVDNKSKLPDGNNCKLSAINSVIVSAFRQQLDYLKSKNIILSEYILPKPNRHPISGYVHELYSKEQMRNYLSCFFLWAEESIKSMLEDNFPNLKEHMSIYQDIPYKTICNLEVDDSNNFYTGLSTYHIDSDKIERPFFTEGQEIIPEKIFKEITSSYLQKGRKSKSQTISSSIIELFIDGNKNLPLSEYVYKIISEEFKKIFRDF